MICAIHELCLPLHCRGRDSVFKFLNTHSMSSVKLLCAAPKNTLSNNASIFNSQVVSFDVFYTKTGSKTNWSQSLNYNNFMFNFGVTCRIA